MGNTCVSSCSFDGVRDEKELGRYESADMSCSCKLEPYWSIEKILSSFEEMLQRLSKEEDEGKSGIKILAVKLEF